MYRIANDEVFQNDWAVKEFRATVYFPMNCKNTCPFCTSRALYNTWGADPEAVIKALDLFVGLRPSKRPVVTITGGEPSYDLGMLTKMLDKLKDCDVYLNSTGLKDNLEDFSNVVLSYAGLVKGVSISRHTAAWQTDRSILRNIATDQQLADEFGETNIRINAVIDDRTPQDRLKLILDRWLPIYRARDGYLDVSLRYDYNKVTQENLHLLDMPIIRKLTDIPFLKYEGHSLCDVCDNLNFLYKGDMPVRFHRGLANTRLNLGDIISIESLVIFHDGLVATDWDRTVDGLDWYLKQMDGYRIRRRKGRK